MSGSQKISPNFHFKLLSSFFIRVLNVSLAMSSGLKNYFGFLVDEISEPVLTIKWHLEQFGANRILNIHLRTEFRLKASFKPIEST